MKDRRSRRTLHGFLSSHLVFDATHPLHACEVLSFGLLLFLGCAIFLSWPKTWRFRRSLLARLVSDPGHEYGESNQGIWTVLTVC